MSGVQGVTLTDVVKVYPSAADDSPPAVDGVNLTIAPGELVSLLGRNGAGKSTLVRMMATLIRPTSGAITIASHDTQRDEVAARRALGLVLGGERSVYWKLTGRQNLQFFAAIRGMGRAEARRAVDLALERVDLSDKATTYAEEYSTGMRQRLVIARALIGDPQVIIMDEPTAGLDPHATASLQELIQRLRGEGAAMLITTHHIEEAEMIADRVAIMEHGRVIALDTPGALQGSMGASGTVTCWFEDDEAEVRTAIPYFQEHLAAVEVGSDGGRTRLRLAGDLSKRTMPQITRVAAGAELQLVELAAEPVTLRHVFLALTGREIHENGETSGAGGDVDE